MLCISDIALLMNMVPHTQIEERGGKIKRKNGNGKKKLTPGLSYMAN